MTTSIKGSYHEIVGQAKEAEADEPAKAIKLYRQAIKMEPHEALPYDRLMILYRRKKDYESELELVNKGIQAFEDFYKSRAEKLVSKHPSAGRLSSQLARALGQTGKKTQKQYLPQPVPKWIKRKETIERRLH